MKIVAAYSYRYEPQWMIDQLHENLHWVDEFVADDGSKAVEVWENRVDRMTRLHAKVRAAKADWVLHTAPDERWSPHAEEEIRDAIAQVARPTVFQFPLREMFTPTAYRSDGVWGVKTRVRLYQLPQNRRAFRLWLPVSIYHLKMIEPENRAERVRVFKQHNHWDNRGRGFDYLDDERGLELTEVPSEYLYHPPYRTYQFKVPG